MQVLIVVPARRGGDRLESKVLLDETGKTLIGHTLERARQAADRISTTMPTEVYAAVDSVAIAEHCIKQVMAYQINNDNTWCGTQRAAYLLQHLLHNEHETIQDLDYVINWQADEPLINPVDVLHLITSMNVHLEFPVGTLVSQLMPQDLGNPNSVKVRTHRESHGVEWFTRSRREDANGLHVGIYAFRLHALLDLTAVPPTTESTEERLEQLSFGMPILGVRGSRSLSINTREDYDQFVREINAQDV